MTKRVLQLHPESSMQHHLVFVQQVKIVTHFLKCILTRIFSWNEGTHIPKNVLEQIHLRFRNLFILFSIRARGVLLASSASYSKYDYTSFVF
jgi:hypothetical protein